MLQWLVASAIILVTMMPGLAFGELAPGTYVLTFPSAPDSQQRYPTLSYLGKPIDFSRFPPGISDFVDSVVRSREPTACLAVDEDEINSSDSAFPPILFLRPVEQPSGETRIASVGATPEPLFLVQADERGFSGKVLGAEALGEKATVIGRRTGPADLSQCMWVAEMLASQKKQAGRQAAADDDPMLSCQPSDVGPGDTLVLRFKVPHPAELAIKAPDRYYTYFLVYDPSGVPPGWKPLLSKKRFRDTSEIKLPISSAEGTLWAAEHPSNERIFTIPGEYKVILTDVLESDAGRPRYTCTVRFTP